MKKSWMFVLATCVLFIAADFLPAVVATPYFQDDDDGISLEDEYSDNALDRLLQTAQKRACIRRGGNCDHRPNDCCYNSSCRCNLWGSNCRCQRMGLFQKWG
ncbi:Conotoxin [Popillia japonica]|uniref:Conotoxin n=1 Tax=Popillia japonica TaxID=7064 RepID=A0AAW1MWG3_POPJA